MKNWTPQDVIVLVVVIGLLGLAALGYGEWTMLALFGCLFGYGVGKSLK